jgi:hypothetical protein
MYVLSFRDMSLRARGAVTSASLFKVDPVDQAYAWDPFQALTLRPADPVGFAQDVQGAHVCFIVHGFNVNRDSGFGAGGAMAQEFKGQGPLSYLAGSAMLDLMTPAVDLFIPVLWPGDWYNFLNYPGVLGTARNVGRNFAAFLTSSQATMRRASFFTHSFGVRVALETMQEAIRPQSRVGQGRPAPVFDTALLTAAASSETVLDSPFYADAVAALQQITVVSAPTDGVLTWAFPIGNPVEQALNLGRDPGDNVALGRDGPLLKTGSPASAKTNWFVVTDAAAPGARISQGHGDYMPAPSDPVPPLPNGWSDKRERIARLSQAIFDGTLAPWPARAKLRLTPAA